MPRNDRRNFYGKLKDFRRQIVMTEIEVSNRGVSVESVDQITGSLVASSAMRDIHVT